MQHQALLHGTLLGGSIHLQRIPGLQLDNFLSNCQLLPCDLRNVTLSVDTNPDLKILTKR